MEITQDIPGWGAGTSLGKDATRTSGICKGCVSQQTCLGWEASDSELLVMPEFLHDANKQFGEFLSSILIVGVIILPSALNDIMSPKLTSFLLELNDRYEGGGLNKDSFLFRNAALVTLDGVMEFGFYVSVDNHDEDETRIPIVTNDRRWFHRGVDFAIEAVEWLFNSFFTPNHPKAPAQKLSLRPRQNQQMKVLEPVRLVCKL